MSSYAEYLPSDVGDNFGGKNVGPESSALASAVDIFQPFSLQGSQREQLGEHQNSRLIGRLNKLHTLDCL